MVVEGGTRCSLSQSDALSRPQGAWRFQGHARNFDELVPAGVAVSGPLPRPRAPIIRHRSAVQSILRHLNAP